MGESARRRPDGGSPAGEEGGLIWVAASPYETAELRATVEGAGFRAANLADVDGLGGAEGLESPVACIVALRAGRGDPLAPLQRLRQEDRARGAPFVVIAEAELGLAAHARELRPGFDHLLVRPVEPGVLVAKLRAVVHAPGVLRDTALPAPDRFHVHPTLGRIDTGQLRLGVAERVERAEGVPAPDGPWAGDPLPRGAGGLPRHSDGEIRVEELGETADPQEAVEHVASDGDLRTADVATLFDRLFRRGFAGTLVLRRDEVEKRIAFDGGRPVFATSSSPHDRLGELLRREGRITWAQYERCQEAMQVTGRRLGAILVDQGLVGARELLALVRRHVAEIIYSVFAWQDGTYELSTAEVAVEERIRLELHPRQVLLEGLRRKYGLERLRELTGALETERAALGEAGDPLRDWGLTPEDRSLVDLIVASPSIGDALAQSDVDELRARQMVFALFLAGALPASAEPVPRTGSARVPEALRARLGQVERQRIRNKHAQIREGDYFALLGVAVDATTYEIAQAYERLRQEFAPLSFPADVLEEYQRQLEEIVEVVEEAYDVLSDEGLRNAYRESLASCSDN